MKIEIKARNQYDDEIIIEFYNEAKSSNVDDHINSGEIVMYIDGSGVFIEKIDLQRMLRCFCD